MNGKKLVGLAVAHIPRGCRPSREIRLSRSDQVARRATRGALRSKVARGRAGDGNRGKCAAGEVFGCIPHGCARAAGVGLPERSEPEGPQGTARERIENSRVEVERL